MSTDTREARLERRIADLFSDDAQFAAAKPDDAVSRAADAAGRLPDVVRTVMEGYADRPAVAQRAVEYVTEAGRTTAKLQPRFDTVSYGQLWKRVQEFAAALQDDPVRPGDRVAILGFTSVDYTVVDIALTQLGAVSVPLQTSAPQTQLQPILAETEPSLIASSIDYVDDAVELVLAGPAPARLVVFDFAPEVDDQRDALEAATARLQDSGVVVETMADVLARGASLPAPQSVVGEGDDPIALLVYTSGSTGAPKGAIYPEAKVANMWRAAANSHWDENQGVMPAITMAFLPMSHVMGRGVLYGTLASGGTVHFAARSDLSTFLEDLALVQPTQMNFVPRIWDMLYQEYVSEVDRAGAEDDDQQVIDELREKLLGHRYVSAVTGSAPISPELRAWVEKFLDMHLLEGYGSTEAGAVFVDGHIRRPPVIDYKLVDVPDLGYYGTDRPHPRGELLLKTPNSCSPATTSGPRPPPRCIRRRRLLPHGRRLRRDLGPDHLVKYVDRRNNVLKLAQGEFVTLVQAGGGVHGNSPLVRQIYVYGNSAQPYLLAVVVPTDEAQSRYDASRTQVGDQPTSLQGRRPRRRTCSPTRCRATSSSRRSTVHPGERAADRHPQAGVAEAQAALRRASWSSFTPTLAQGQADELSRSCGRPAPIAPVLRDHHPRRERRMLGAAKSDRPRRMRTSPI